MKLPVRSVLVPVKTGSVLISPGSQLKIEQLKSLKSVTDIVAPNLFHCAGVPKAISVFPNAKVWGVSGTKVLKPDILWTAEISVNSWPYQSELFVLPIRGMPKINEVVFIHKQSKTLIVTDLCFNLMEAKGIGAWIILNLFGTHKQFGVSRFFIKYIEEQQDFEFSIKELFSFDFENIVVAHGGAVQGGAKKILKAALLRRGIRVDAQ